MISTASMHSAGGRLLGPIPIIIVIFFVLLFTARQCAVLHHHPGHTLGSNPEAFSGLAGASQSHSPQFQLLDSRSLKSSRKWPGLHGVRAADSRAWLQSAVNFLSLIGFGAPRRFLEKELGTSWSTRTGHLKDNQDAHLHSAVMEQPEGAAVGASRRLLETGVECLPPLETGSAVTPALAEQRLREQAKVVLEIYLRAGCRDWVREFADRPLTLCSDWPGVLCGNGSLLTSVDENILSSTLEGLENSTVADAAEAWHVTGVSIQGLVSNNTTPFRWPDPNSLRYAIAQVYTSTRVNVNQTTCWVNQTGPLDSIDFSALRELRVFSLRKLNMSGTFPVPITQLCRLERVALSQLMYGPVPESLSNLKALQYLNLNGNRQVGNLTGGFSGPFPQALLSLTNLQEVHLSNNSFSGEIPGAVFSQLLNLQELKARANFFSGSIPVEIGQAKSLQQLDLQQNRLTGELPASLGQLASITDLILSLNNFSGSLPPGLGSLTTLKRLSVEGAPPLGGSLTGEVPNLANLQNLTTLKLAYNKLTGPLPDWINILGKLNKISLDHNRFYGVFSVAEKVAFECVETTVGSNLQVANYGYNYFNTTELGTFFPGINSKCPDRFAQIWADNVPGNCFYNITMLDDPKLPLNLRIQLQNTSRPKKECDEFYAELRQQMQGKKKSGKKNRALIVTAIVIGVCAVVGALVLGLAFLWLRKRQDDLSDQGKGKTVNNAGVRNFGYEEVKAITENFKHPLGRGGFGTVSWGRLPDGAEVAVKMRQKDSHQGRKELLNEIDALRMAKHRHLVNIVGYCIEGNQEILLFEYVPGGCLKDLLKKGVMVLGGQDGIAEGNEGQSSKQVAAEVVPQAIPLPWASRLKIALGAAKGITYLHYDAHATKALIHRDIKTSNILIDSNWDAKVADFGLTKVADTALSALDSIPESPLQVVPVGPGGEFATKSRDNLSDSDVDASSKEVSSKSVTSTSQVSKKSRQNSMTRNSQSDRESVAERTQVKGTLGYMDPLYAAGQHLSLASDVYSFGTVLWVLITGKEPSRWPPELNPPTCETVIQHVDPRMPRDQELWASIQAVAELAEACTSSDNKARPTMKAVTLRLEILHDQLESKGRHAVPAAPPVPATIGGVDSASEASFQTAAELDESVNFSGRLVPLNSFGRDVPVGFGPPPANPAWSSGTGPSQSLSASMVTAVPDLADETVSQSQSMLKMTWNENDNLNLQANIRPR